MFRSQKKKTRLTLLPNSCCPYWTTCQFLYLPLFISNVFFCQYLKCRPLVKNYPITRRQILDSSKLKEFADDNFKFDENGRKLSKWVENTVGKGEIARYEQFLLFSQCFQKACFPGASKGVIVWERVKRIVFTLKYPVPFRCPCP